MIDDKNIKLVECSYCGKAFYVKTEHKDNFKMNCPFCENEVVVEINKKQKDESSQSTKP